MSPHCSNLLEKLCRKKCKDLKNITIITKRKMKKCYFQQVSCNLILILIISTLDFNECEVESFCGEGASCENLEGSHRCVCHEGYEDTVEGCGGKMACVRSSLIYQQHNVFIIV